MQNNLKKYAKEENILNVNFTTRARNLIVSVSGELDQHKASGLREQIDLRITHANIRNLVFDFSNLEFMDSSGIGVIIGRYKLMRAMGGTVQIVANKQSVKKILELSGIRKIIGIHETLSDAVKTA